MRKYMNLLIIFILLCCAACGKQDSDPTPSHPIGGTYIRMKIDGVQWESSKGSIVGISKVDGKYNLTIAGIDEDFSTGNSQMSLIFSNPESITPGSYFIKDLDGGASITKIEGKTYMVVDYDDEDIHCTVSITHVSGTAGNYKIRGTFSGVFGGSSSGDLLEVADGAFGNY